MIKSKKITDGALLTAVFIVLLLIIVFVPVIMLFGIFILPVPFIMYAARYGYKPGVIMAVVSIVLSFIFASFISLPLTIFACIGGLVIGDGIYRKRNPYETFALGTVGFIIGFVLVLALVQFVFAFNLFAEMDLLVGEWVDMTRSVSSVLPQGVITEEQIKFFEEQMLHITDLIPASIALASMLFAFIGQWISYKITNRIENSQLSFPPFKNLNFPVIIIWIYLITILMSFVKMDPDGMLYLILVNVTALTIVFIVIQGFSFVFFYMDHKNIHKSVPIIILVVSILLPIFMYIIRIIGIIDLGFSLKNRIGEQKMRK